MIKAITISLVVAH